MWIGPCGKKKTRMQAEQPYLVVSIAPEFSTQPYGARRIASLSGEGPAAKPGTSIHSLLPTYNGGY
jgi:hypothetical protein